MAKRKLPPSFLKNIKKAKKKASTTSKKRKR